MNPPVRLLALDMDGTLFAEDLRISLRVRAAVQAAAHRGVLIATASGRIAAEGMRVVADLGLMPAQVAPLICYQGAMVYDLAAGPILARTLDPSTALELIDYARGLDLGVNLHTVDEMFVERPQARDQFYAEVSNLSPIRVPDLAALVRERELRPLKLVFVTEQPRPAELADAINAAFAGRVYAARTYVTFCEVVHPLANKGAALAFVAARLDIPLAQVMAIGDNHNDVPMLRRAGVSVAMGHAAPEVKAAARYVTDSLADDGVATAIQRFILEGS